MEFLLMLCVIMGIVYGARSYHKRHDISSLPSLQQVKLDQEKEEYFVLGMQEVNRFLAPRQLPEPIFVDVGCTLCDAIRMNVTENELDAEGWTCVNGVTRCPLCSAGKKPRPIWNGTCPCGASATNPQGCICKNCDKEYVEIGRRGAQKVAELIAADKLGQPDKYPYWCQYCKGWTAVEHTTVHKDTVLLTQHVHNDKCGCNAC